MALSKKWSYNLTEKAKRDLNKLDKSVQKKILAYLDSVINSSPNPRIKGSALRANLSSYWRYRVGDYRIIGHFEDAIFTISVVKVAHRKEVYTTNL